MKNRKPLLKPALLSISFKTAAPLLLAGTATAFAASGCASFTPNMVVGDAVKVERVDSRNVRIKAVQAHADSGRLRVSGHLEKRYSGRSPIPGRLHIEALGDKGLILGKTTSGYQRRSGKSGRSYFSRTLTVQPALVRVDPHGLTPGLATTRKQDLARTREGGARGIGPPIPALGPAGPAGYPDPPRSVPQNRVSHDAYLKAKRCCKRTATPCVLLKSSGVASFARALEQVAA